MPSNRLRHTLYLRKLQTAKGRTKRIWYVKIIDAETGERVKRCSTGESNKSLAETEARRIVNELEAQGVTAASTVTVADLIGDAFDHHGAYAESRRARGHRVALTTLDNMAGMVRKHIEPVFGDKPVTDITSAIIDGWLIQELRTGTLAAATLNRLLQGWKIILDLAVARGIIAVNPARQVKPLHVQYKQKGVLSDDEVRELLRWPGPFHDYRHLVLNRVAFSTGMRLGEIQGLTIEHVHRDHIEVTHTWERNYGLKEPKYGSLRSVPLLPTVYDGLRQIIDETEAESIVFYGKTKDVPIAASTIQVTFKRAVARLLAPDGLPERQARAVALEEIRTRNISFHGWRHKANTLLRSSGIADSKIRQITGHRAEHMTDHYTQFNYRDFADVAACTGALIDSAKEVAS